MRNLLFIILCLTFPPGLKAQQEDPRLAEPEVPKMEFAETVVDVGELSISMKDRRKVTFEFVNKGDAPLLIKSVETTCSCTVATFRNKPVKPGKKGKVTVKVDASQSELLGPFTNLITVVNNTPQHYTRIRVTGKFTD